MARARCILTAMAICVIALPDGADAAEQLQAPYLVFPSVPLEYSSLGPSFGTSDVATGDMNGDGRADLVLVSRALGGGQAGLLSVIFSDGNPTVPMLTQPLSYKAGLSPTRLAVGDLDNDGRLDAVTCDSITVSVFRNMGGGNMSARTTFPVGAPAKGIALSDLNGDGRLDIAVAAADGARVLLAFGPPGVFAPPMLVPVAGSPVAVAAGFIDDDAIPDLLLATESPNTLTLLHGLGPGTFAVGTTALLFHTPTGLALADMTNDGKPDAVVTSAATPFVTIYQGGGMAPFAAVTADQSLPNPAYDLIAQDLNQDGSADVALVTQVSPGSAIETCSVLLGDGTGGFADIHSYDLGTYLEAIAAGDFNGDGLTDLVACGPGAPSTFQHAANVLIQKRPGVFGLDPSYRTPAYDATACRVIKADMNRDGKDDLIVAGINKNTGQASVTIRPGNGDGTWQPGVEYAVLGDDVPRVIAGDFNRDGKPDLVVSQMYIYEAPSTMTYLGNGDGTVAPLGSSVLDSKKALAAGDFDRDGKLDIAADTYLSDAFAVLRGNGDGTFTQSWSYFVAGYFTREGAVGDVNRDGKLDLAVTVFNSTPPTGSYVFLGNGDGTMAPPLQINYLNGVDVSLQDATNDGILDLVMPSYGSGLTISVGNGDGTFAPFVYRGRDYNGSTSALVADTNRDGRRDLIMDVIEDPTDSDPARVDVLLGNAPPMVFGAGSSYGVGRVSCGLTLVDANRDGRDDVIAAEADPGNASGTAWIRTLLGNGPPAFDFPGNILSSAAPSPELTVALADFTRDTKVDALITRYDPGQNNYQSTLMTGDGNGGFAAGTSYPLPDEPGATAVGDLNRDGIPDVAIACSAGDAVMVQLGTLAGPLAAPAVVGIGLGYEFSDIAIGDFNRDGKPDLAVASAASYAILIFLGNGDGTFARPTAVSTGSAGPTSIGVGDINRDGSPDLVAALGVGISPNSIGLLLGNGAGGFQSIQLVSCGDGPNALALADLNRDGILDVAVTRTGISGNHVAILLGTQGGSFGSPTEYPLGGSGFDIAAADIDGDGILDLIAPNGYRTSTFSYLHGLGDGIFAASEDHVIGDSPVALAVADLNADGRPDVAGALSGVSNLGVSLSGPSTVSAVPASPGLAPPAPRLTIRPNPASGRAVLSFWLPVKVDRASVDLFDVRGRHVARLHDGPAEGGLDVAWTGRVDGGARAASGVYFVRLTAEKSTLTRRLVWVR